MGTSIIGRFIKAGLVWGLGLAVAMVAAGTVSEGVPSALQVARWLARAMTLAAFPAGLAVAGRMLDAIPRWRGFAHAAAGAILFSLGVLLLSLAAPPLGDGARSFAALFATLRDAQQSWEARNDAAWTLLATVLTGPQTLMLGAIGAQVGVWARFSLPATLHRPLYWTVGIGLLVSHAAIWDTTYETIVLHTEADASFAALYTLLLPLALVAGLGLPTLTILRDHSAWRP